MGQIPIGLYGGVSSRDVLRFAAGTSEGHICIWVILTGEWIETLKRFSLYQLHCLLSRCGCFVV